MAQAFYAGVGAGMGAGMGAGVGVGVGARARHIPRSAAAGLHDKNVRWK